MPISVRRGEILPALSLPPTYRRCCYVTARDPITWTPDHVTLLWWHVKCTWSGARSCPQNNQCMMRRYGRVRVGPVFGNKCPSHVIMADYGRRRAGVGIGRNRLSNKGGKQDGYGWHMMTKFFTVWWKKIEINPLMKSLISVNDSGVWLLHWPAENHFATYVIKRDLWNPEFWPLLKIPPTYICACIRYSIMELWILGEQHFINHSHPRKS